MRTGRVAITKFQTTFTATGTYDPYLDVVTAKPWPLAVSPLLWSLQVSGYNNSNALTAPSAWDVYLLGSNDGINFTTGSSLVEHTNTGSANANGDVAWSANTTPGQFRGCKYVRLKVNTLTLGSATIIKVFAEGY
jgi:hypothetical protein